MNMKKALIATLSAGLLASGIAQADESRRFRDREFRGQQEQRIERIERLERRADTLQHREDRLDRRQERVERKITREKRKLGYSRLEHDHRHHKGHRHVPAHGYYMEKHGHRHNHRDLRVYRYMHEYRQPPRVYHSIPRPVTVIEHTYPRPPVETHVVVESHGHGDPVRTLAGGIIGGAIANGLSDGDRGATAFGAITGAIIANRH